MLSVFLGLAAFAAGPKYLEPTGVLEATTDFFAWLESQTQTLAHCEPQFVSSPEPHYLLCDQTEIPQKLLKELFKKSPKDLLSWVRSQGVDVQVLCDTKKPKQGEFFEGCKPDGVSGNLQKVSALHGQYLSGKNTAIIRSTASPGSLIHEYLHHLQWQNLNFLQKRHYKKERIQIQDQLVQVMDQEIQEVKRYEKAGSKAQVKDHLAAFNLASESLRHFALWQDLIDERGLFQLYVKFGADFGIAENDRNLSTKNLKFICKNKILKSVLPISQCKF